MKSIFLLLNITLLLSCTFDSPGPQRAEFWKNEVVKVNEEKPSLEVLLSKYQEYQPKFDKNSNSLVIVDSGKSNSIVCREWHYIFKVKINENKLAVDAVLEQTGTCL